MLKNLAVILLTISLLLTLSACNSNVDKDVSPAPSEASSTEQGKLNVVVSFDAMREFAIAVGKDKISVQSIIPDGTEPHSFSPKASDIETLNTAQLFVYSGMGMESAWVDKTLDAVENSDLVVVEASQGVIPIKFADAEAEEDHSEFDPHVWLSLKNAEIEAGNIKKALIEIDPSNETFYETNYSEFQAQLETLYDDYATKLSTVSNKNFVTGHAAFGYLCRDFGLTQNSVQDVFATGEPSAKKLKELVEYCIANNITTIFVEDMVSPKVSETLANEVGAKVEVIYTIASHEDGKDYITRMTENLEKIYEALK
ncbi:metal ABC transporter solute-binding protein, Zn/Mn family [Fusibacter ferrireducens]|uniref:Zinc ABC transporter substrate-binding protein n=1 Tax=Fusibacter ferrireducens TaxID=2785058 RepID=A0ABR9ZR41_9FIRM|nr:zinc ABC transporter substrate-binding protein [Fusibacter ferrireducens]MBF4692446.1 zinc ABC transporter substrate-binding protein [Fusibacter ferrireducens]